MTDVKIAILPEDETRAAMATPEQAIARRRLIKLAVEAAGGQITSLAEANCAAWLLVDSLDELKQVLRDNPQIEWVQLPWAGVEPLFESGFFSPEVVSRNTIFTCAKAAYSEEVAEHALTMTLALMRHLVVQLRTPRWLETDPVTLYDKRVTILGGGGIAGEFVSLVKPFRAKTTVVRRSAEPVPGAGNTVSVDALLDELATSDVLLLALPLTPESRHIIGAKELAALPNHALVVNVARGGHIDADALVDALRNGEIAGAALDVTDPEPLPEGHPLWMMNNVIITSHCANSVEQTSQNLARRISGNVAKRISGEQLTGLVDINLGY